MKEKSLARLLFVPLSAAAGLSMTAALLIREPWRSLLVNLAASFLGSMVTVFYVDKILRRNEERRWERVKGHVGKQVTLLANATASSVRTALHLPPPDMWDDPDALRDPARMRQMMINVVEQNLLPQISGLARMDQSGWRTFATNLRGTIFNCERLISLFGSKLDPGITALILDLHEKAREVLFPYEVIPDMLGVPFEELKPNRRGRSSVPMVRAMLDGTIRDAEQLLRICVTLLRETGVRFPERDPTISTNSSTA